MESTRQIYWQTPFSLDRRSENGEIGETRFVGPGIVGQLVEDRHQVFPGYGANASFHQLPRQELPVHQIAGDSVFVIVALEDFLRPGRSALYVAQPFLDQAGPAAAELRPE